MQHYTVYFIWKVLYMFQVVPPSIIRSANNGIYSIWYLPHWLLLSVTIVEELELGVGGISHPLHTQTSSNSSTIATDSSNKCGK
jgi:hypothetical protein